MVANDGLLDSQANITYIHSNRPGSSFPVAMTGPDLYVTTGSIVQLDGSASYSPELSFGTDALLDYEWKLLYWPSGSAALLNDVTAVKPSFTADVSGTYVFRLKVSDDGRANRTRMAGVMNNVVVVFAGNGNIPPKADGGADIVMDEAVEVTLNGSNSSNAEDASLSYDWSIFKAPTGSSQALTSSNQVSNSFTPDLNGIDLIRLVVNDGQDDSEPDIVRIVADTPDIGVNRPPAADAGPDQANAVTGIQVTLDGSGSSDPENIPLSYLWSILNQPTGGTAVLSDTTAMGRTFTPNVDGEYVVCLVVSDGSLESLPVEVSITASAVDPFTELNLFTGLPFAPAAAEVATLMVIDLVTSNTLDLVDSTNLPNGVNDEHVALYATIDFATGTAGDFYTNPFWTWLVRPIQIRSVTR